MHGIILDYIKNKGEFQFFVALFYIREIRVGYMGYWVALHGKGSEGTVPSEFRISNFKKMLFE